MLALTDPAATRFKKILAEEKRETHGIRIFASGGGCCGPSMAIDIAQEAHEGDVTLEKDGLKVFLEKEINDLLIEATLDFSENRGFILSGMPQSSCCG